MQKRRFHPIWTPIAFIIITAMIIVGKVKDKQEKEEALIKAQKMKK